MAQDEKGTWHSCRVFVTGATGLLGSALVSELVGKGADVTCLLRDWVPTSRLVVSNVIENTNVVAGDLLDPALLVRIINEYEIDTVFHLAAQAVVGTGTRSPLSTFESNIRGTWNLLEACRLNARTVQRVIVASSDKAYGVHERLPYSEDAPLQGRSPYDVSKACADLIAFSYFHTYRTPVAVTRCGNLWGPGDLNYSRLIPGTIRSALLDEPPIVRSDGTYCRDYFYVRDAVSAYLTLAEQILSKDLAGQAFNFSNERPATALDIVHAILEALGKLSLSPIILNQANGEIHDQYLDCSKARRVLNWTARYTFEDGLRETIPWYRDRIAAPPHPRPE